MSCKQSPFYSASDFEKVQKIDVHFHYNTPDIRYLQFADSLNFRFVSPNVDAEMPIDEQLEIAASLKNQFPDQFTFLGTFSVDSFNNSGFAEETIARIDQCMKAGASGIKIWKNIGMTLKDTSGRYVMADDPAFKDIFRYMEANKIPLMAHLGEPKNCWLPENEMTLDNDRRYFKNHPEYHMYLHPEAPSYQDQLDARDSLLRKYPALNVVGAHLGSMEWSVDEIAARLDRFPNFYVDMSARIGHLQYQALTDREKVRDFMIRYQNRIMYGTDMAVDEADASFVAVANGLRNRWFEQWLFLATDSMIEVKDLGGQKVKGLQLPREVIDKIYSRNTEELFKIKNRK
ncbi:MAG: hypothetical protein A2W90_15020 [Bacteroidetes bacterium GWF2_42_66]|nr:MAG: hypothetical protein A2W92_15450 [Bacteroidetes bacterium GWA2_42_15]OFX99822.1 MAG: hypothetical protein A2W89_07210 [Bacteroidetes bacterium GWE2_42_39]OFY46651.1 MAG: hypothetical protein A2W90_15020 [Bacteroidetes bacterium GWF2_42_66]